MNSYDIIIVGSGAGGGTLAYALSKTNKKILIIERGDFLPRSKDNWDPQIVFRQGIYNAPEPWFFNNSGPINPKQFYFVGGNTRFYGALMLRLRERDFEEVQHEGGTSPSWPISYNDLEPYYCLAEKLMEVRGRRGEDITEPPASAPYSFPPIPHDSETREVVEKISSLELNPSHLPLALQLNSDDLGNSRCIRCDTCDGYPCLLDAKNDAENRFVRPAIQYENVRLETGTKVKKLETDNSGRLVSTVIAERSGGEEVRFCGDIVVLCAGALNSALILLASASDRHPRGMANSSGMVGRNLMFHNARTMVAVYPGRKFVEPFPKTFMINDFYFGDPFDKNHAFPLGCLQPLGKITSSLFRAIQPIIPNPVARYLEHHSLNLAALSEDLPSVENRVETDRDGNIHVYYRKNNLSAFRRLEHRARRILKSIGFSLIVGRTTGLEATGHQCGTTRFGIDPKTSVLDTFCKAHDLENLYVVDAGFFPSSSATNPSLTIIANSLRVADRIKERLA